MKTTRLCSGCGGRHGIHATHCRRPVDAGMPLEYFQGQLRAAADGVRLHATSLLAALEDGRLASHGPSQRQVALSLARLVGEGERVLRAQEALRDAEVREERDALYALHVEVAHPGRDCEDGCGLGED